MTEVSVIGKSDIEIVDDKNRRIVVSRKEAVTVAYHILCLTQARFGLNKDGKFVIYLQGEAST